MLWESLNNEALQRVIEHELPLMKNKCAGSFESLRRTLAQPDLHGRNGESVFDMKPMHVKQFIRTIPASVFTICLHLDHIIIMIGRS
jgi:hypothetical protein